MNPKLKEFETRFKIVTNGLKALGFRGDVFLSGGLVMFGCKDKYQASFIRKAMKQIKNADKYTFIENRFKTGSAVFTIVIDECFAVKKKDIRKRALEFIALAA